MKSVNLKRNALAEALRHPKTLVRLHFALISSDFVKGDTK